MIIRESRRSCFYFSENISFRFAIFNWTPVNQADCTLSFYLDKKKIESREIASLGTHNDSISWEYDSTQLRLGEHTLKVAIKNKGGINLASTFKFSVVRQPNANGIENWHWPATVHYDALEASRESALKELDKLQACGFTWANFRDQWAMLHPDDAIFLIEEAMKRGISLGILIENAKHGIFRKENAPDSECIVTEKGEVKDILNPHTQYFHDKVVLHTQRLMELFAEFPAVKILFANSELEDILSLACNKETKKQHEKKLGFKLEKLRGIFRTDAFAFEDAPFTKPGVVADDDCEVEYMKYYFTEGDGWAKTNRLMAETAHKYRPDLLVFSDPYRLCPIPQRFEGMDAVSSWTYTNPDPKASLFIETLDCASRHLGNYSIPSITLWNYAGSIFPSGANRFARDKTVRMGPGRWKECAWFYLSRGPRAIGSYFGSPMEIFIDGGDDFIYSHATEKAIHDFNENILQPFGEIARSTHNVKRNVAFLDCLTARVYGDSEREYTHYANYQIYNFGILFAMSHIPFDVIIEDDVLNGDLKQYKMLVLARADVLSESVYKQICAYAKSGGIVVVDSHCKAKIPCAICFDFDFSARKGVNANALSANMDYASKDDKNSVAIVAKKQVQGITATQDRLNMEAFAKQLRSKLDSILARDIDCSTPRIILNAREDENAMYIFAINDERTYDERTSIWKSMEEKGLPISGTITLKTKFKAPQFRELLTGKLLKAVNKGSVWNVDIDLPPASGAIIAVTDKGSLPKPTISRKVSETCVTVEFANCGKAMRPFKIEFNKESHIVCTHGDTARFLFPLGPSDDIPKRISVKDLL